MDSTDSGTSEIALAPTWKQPRGVVEPPLPLPSSELLPPYLPCQRPHLAYAIMTPVVDGN